jgi:hypothetical protein
MKLQKLNKESVVLKKSEMTTIKGGITNTEYHATSFTELEQEIDDKGAPVGDPILIDFPSNP